jgi:hypothetical protein
VPDTDKIGTHVRRALGAQYALMPGSELATALENVATAQAFDDLYHFESADSRNASAAVDLNLALESDALFVARLYRRPVASADAPPCGEDSPWRLELHQLAGRSV